MFIKPVRIGNNPELRYTTGGDAVLNLACAYNYGKKKDGKQPTQWIDATIWGKSAEGLAPYLAKGAQIVIYCDDVHIEEYQKNGETKAKLVARIVSIDFIGNRQDEKPQAPAKKPDRAQSSGFDDDTNIPF